MFALKWSIRVIFTYPATIFAEQAFHLPCLCASCRDGSGSGLA
jgi:hypothetical protein